MNRVNPNPNETLTLTLIPNRMKSEKNREENPKGDEEKEKGEEGKGPTSPCTALPPRRRAGRRLSRASYGQGRHR